MQATCCNMLATCKQHAIKMQAQSKQHASTMQANRLRKMQAQCKQHTTIVQAKYKQHAINIPQSSSSLLFASSFSGSFSGFLFTPGGGSVTTAVIPGPSTPPTSRIRLYGPSLLPYWTRKAAQSVPPSAECPFICTEATTHCFRIVSSNLLPNITRSFFLLFLRSTPHQSCWRRRASR